MDHGDTSGRSPRPWLLVLVLVVAAVIVAEILAISREGPDVSLRGRVTTVELHRLCVSPGGARATCLQVEAPSETDGISVGDCVSVLFSPEKILVSVQEASGC